VGLVHILSNYSGCKIAIRPEFAPSTLRRDYSNPLTPAAITAGRDAACRVFCVRHLGSILTGMG
jgi:hypothetical protein